jgi:hypothetical protein
MWLTSMGSWQFYEDETKVDWDLNYKSLIIFLYFGSKKSLGILFFFSNENLQDLLGLEFHFLNHSLLEFCKWKNVYFIMTFTCQK